MPSGSRRQNHMGGGRVECATRHRWGEDPGEDEAQERIGHPSPSPAIGGRTDPPVAQDPEGDFGSPENITRG